MQRFGAGYFSAQIAYSHFNNTTTRTITGIGPDETAKGAFGSDQFGGRLEIGRSFDFGTMFVTPFAAVQAARLWQSAYTETSTAGAAPGVLGLSYAAQAVSSLPIFLGAKFDGRSDFGNGMIWTPFVHAAWVHEFEPSRTITASLTTLPVPAFTIAGASAASDAARLDLGSRLALIAGGNCRGASPANSPTSARAIPASARSRRAGRARAGRATTLHLESTSY